jgi:glycosyltransferase involved in cell wall biosynthesis
MDPNLHNKKVAFSVTNCICFDQRVLKMAEAISTLNCDITIIGRERGECCKTEIVPFRTHRFNMLFKRGFLFYKFFNIRLFFYLLFHRFDLLVSNDLDTLLPNFLVSRLKRLPLVYDSHEFFTGLPEIQNRHFVKWVWTTVEKWIFPKLKYVITVSEPIASLYEKMYDVRPLVIRNFSKESVSIVPYTRRELGIIEEDLLLVIQGTGINIDKGSEELVDAVKISDRISLIVIGGGDILDILKTKVTALNISDKVKFFPAVSWENLMKFTKAADLGMCLEKDTNINYRYSLPNKLFDYISAGIPVITGELPEISKIIMYYNCGVITRNITPSEISGAVTQLLQNPDQLIELKKNANKASQELSWKIESEKVKALYVSILTSQDCNTA